VPVADPPPPGDEYDYWLDPNCPPPSSFSPNKVWKDGYRLGEKYIDVIGMDGYLSIQDLEEVKVRVTDYRDNWTRSGNLLEDTEGLHTVTMVGILTEDYSGTTVLSEFCSVPVVGRGQYGEYPLDYAAQVLVSDLNDPPYSINSEVNSPSHEGNAGPGEINVPLYRVIPGSDRYNELNSLFPYQGLECNVQYYSRGSSLLGPPGGTCYQVYITDLNESEAPESENDFVTIPILYVSDNDLLLPVSERKDYSVASCGGDDMQTEIEWGFYSPAINALYYGENRYCRGRFLLDCDGEDKQNCAQDVLKCGFEKVMVKSEGEVANIGVQSRGDVYFVLAHGVSFDWGHPEFDYDLSKFEAMGSFIECDPVQYSYSIGEIWIDSSLTNPPAPYSWSGSELYSPEIRYLISDACSILNNYSYTEWQWLINNNGLISISAFRSANYWKTLPGGILDGNPSQFFASLSARLTNCHGQPMEIQYWDNLNIIPYGDDGIIGWMENACFWAQEQNRLEQDMTVQWCSSINSENRYVLKQQLNTSIFPPKTEWKIYIG
ncbi:MAG: hypothetical protein NTY09_12645, partial [bacterium]|nr:hypothetical protein [bacterium]